MLELQNNDNLINLTSFFYFLVRSTSNTVLLFFILMVSLQLNFNVLNATRLFKTKSKRTHNN